MKDWKINGHEVTHMGWYGLCPIFLAEADEGRAAHITPRSWWLWPLYMLMFPILWLFSLFFPGLNNSILITGERIK